MHGKTVFITGATNGIGLETARALAAKGARVVIGGRNPQKTANAVEELRASTGNADIHSILGDLSLMSESRRVAGEFDSRFDRLDILINNAGGTFGARSVTAEGLELTFALNHMNYYIITRLLLDKLKASGPSRVVSVASHAHRFSGRLNFDDLQSEKGMFIGFQRYSETKLMNVMFTLALARRLDPGQVTAHAIHPGFVNTGFGHTSNGPISLLMRGLGGLVGKTPEQGAQPSILAATSPEGGTTTGAYWDTTRIGTPSKTAQDTEAHERLWRVSAELAGLPVD